MAIQLAAVDHASVVPFDSLGTLLIADTVSSGAMRVYVSYKDSVLSSVRHDIYVITHTNIAGNKYDTIIVRRGKPRDPIPLK